MAKKIMSLMLAVCMVLCLMPTAVFAEGSTAPADITGSGTADDPYLIYKAAGLKKFRDKVNGANGQVYQSDACATLMNDIVLNDGTFDEDGNYTPGASGKNAEEWTPIGNDNTSYSGTFDGNGKTIKGLYVTGQQYAGLFGYVMSHDPTDNAKFEFAIRNLTVTGYIGINTDSSTEAHAGGIVGRADILAYSDNVSGTISGCVSYVVINARNTDDNSTHVYAGGIVGRVDMNSNHTGNMKITNCANYAAITAYSENGHVFVGGIAGKIEGTGPFVQKIDSCFNAGRISGNIDNSYSNYVGGIIGRASSSSADSSIDSCLNVGEVTGTAVSRNMGGIAGHVIKISISNCCNAGKVGEDGGGIAKYVIDAGVSNCYYLEGTADMAYRLSGTPCKDGLSTKAEFADGTVLRLLQNGNENSPWEKCGYLNAAGMIVPLLKGQTSDTFPIYTAEDLKTFRDSVNAGNTDINAKLMNDIVLNDGTFDEDGNYTKGASGKDAEAWEPIGWKTDDDKTPYSGTFEGNGHTVKGLYVKDVQYAGLFGYAEGATVKNMAVGGYISTSVDESCSGGIAGYLSGGSVTGCLNSCTVNAKEYAGGIVGVISQSGKVTDCGNTGTISGSLTAGGIVGYTRKTDIPVQNCYNIGAVSSSKEYAGGIVGLHGLGVIKNCYWLTGTAKHTAGFIGDADLNTHGDKSKEDFANGTVLNLLKNGRTDSPWTKTGYVAAAGLTLPLLSWQTADSHVHNTDGPFGGCTCGEGPAGTAADPYLISTAEELKAFRELVNNGETDAFAKLMKDIDLGGEAWTPIANYTGTFDGNGKTISGLNVKGVINAGLFGTLSGSAVVKNLTVAGSVEASNTDGDSYAGGIAAKIGGSAQIIDCVNNATVKATVNNDVDDKYTAYAGGMAGHAEQNAKITGCTNNGTLEADSTMADAYTGGMAGYTKDSVVIENCLNTAELSAVASCSQYLSDGVTEYDKIESRPFAGGMVGRIFGVTITGCFNTGAVTARGTGSYPQQPNAAGMLGFADGNVTITDCGNTGKITASRNERASVAGGIVGSVSATEGTVFTVSHCYSTGEVPSDHRDSFVGGIAGSGYASQNTYTISDCYWLTGSCGSGVGHNSENTVSVIRTEAHSKSDFANGTVLELLKQNGTTNAWDMCGYVEAADMTLPLLKWQTLNARKYDISVVDKDGEAVQITSLNQNDVLGDGTVSFVYDEANEKGILTLNGAELSSEYEFPIDAFDMENLEIVLKGKNKIQAEETCITAVNLTFSGEGSLDITNSFFYAVDCTGAVTVNGGSIKIDSPYSALCFDSAFTVNGGTVELIGAANTAIVPNFTDLVIILADDRIMLAGRFYDGSDAQVTAASDADAISEAKYVKILGKYIPVTYDPGQYGEGSAATQNKTYGDDFGLADALFTRTGYRQTAWTTAENGGEILRLGSAYSGNEPLTLYPVWEMEQYSITYDLGGGKLDDSAPRTYMYGDTVTLPIPTKTGYTFDGWYKNSEMTGDKVTEITSTQTGDIELYAKWNECTHDWDSQKNGGWKPVNGSDDGHERICGKCSFTESGLCSKVSSNWAMEQDEHVKRCNTCKRELDRSADHKWGDWKIVKQATCTEPGKKEHTCEYCGITANEVIKAVGHSKSDKLTYSLGGDTHWYTCKNCDANLDEVKHTFDKTKVDDKYLASPATCTAPAKYYKSCECGAYTTDETFEHGEPNGHKWGDWKQLDSPTCTDNGAEIRECSVCHAKESKNIDPNGHDWENDYTVDKEPTCTKDGSKSIHCKNCDAVKDSTTINALGHTFGEWKTISAPTCTAAGTEKRVCTDCDYSETRTVDANGHKWENDYTVDKEPTCTKDGSKSIHCKNCDAVKDSKTIDALGHSFGEWSTVKQPTCTENGTKERICTVCQNKESKEIKATGHSTGKADCIHKAVCENCGDEYGDLNPDNHSNLIHINGNEATHLKEGNIEYWYCEGCHKYFVKDGDGYKEITESETKTPKTTDHKPNETGWNKDDEYHWYVCECGEVLNKDKHDCRHEVVNERCDKPGREYKQCMVCGYVEDEKEVAPKPHSYGNWIIIKKPTATSKGEQKRSCTVCGNEEVEELPIDNSQAVPNPPTDVGDNNILLWIILMFMGCGLFVSDRLFGRKKRKNK